MVVALISTPNLDKKEYDVNSNYRYLLTFGKFLRGFDFRFEAIQYSDCWKGLVQVFVYEPFPGWGYVTYNAMSELDAPRLLPSIDPIALCLRVL